MKLLALTYEDADWLPPWLPIKIALLSFITSFSLYCKMVRLEATEEGRVLGYTFKWKLLGFAYVLPYFSYFTLWVRYCMRTIKEMREEGEGYDTRWIDQKFEEEYTYWFKEEYIRWINVYKKSS